MSIGRKVQKDSNGDSGIVIFTAKGAVLIRANSKFVKELTKFVQDADEQGLVEGTAQQRNFVYVQSFDTSGEEKEVRSDENEIDVDQDAAAFSVSHSLFANRIKMDKADHVIDFLNVAGIGKAALLPGLEHKSIRGLPVSVTWERIQRFNKYIGKDVEQLTAEITKMSPHRGPDYTSDVTQVPGEVMQIDGVDSSFSRLKHVAPLDSQAKGKKKVIPSIGGFKDAIIAVDVASGYTHMIGRMTKKNPHVVMEQFVSKWIGRWKALKVVRADKEFITPQGIEVMNKIGCRFRQSVPGDHRRNTGMIEGCLRWIQEAAQVNMNRLAHLVNEGIISDVQSKTFWFHALRQAVFAFNAKPSLCDRSKTRYEEGTGDVFNLAHLVFMPFGMRVVGKSLQNGDHGRGVECIYLGPSATVRGGILTYAIQSQRVSVKYSFIPIPNVQRLNGQQLIETSQEIYGHLEDSSAEHEDFGFDEHPDIEDDDSVGTDRYATDILGVDHELPDEELAKGPTEEVVPSTKDPTVEVTVDLSPEIQIPEVESRGGSKVVVSDYNTRSKSRNSQEFYCLVLSVEEEDSEEEGLLERLPMPAVPSARARAQNPLWISAGRRETKKLLAEDTFLPLPKDKYGSFIRSEGAIVLRLLKIAEYKWKPDPITGKERLLEFYRYVCDGSTDDREEKLDAETPDRTLLFL
jgi:hypothetical protein